VAAPLAWFGLLRQYQKDRVLTFLDPAADPLGTGWNILQSRIAIGSGGWDGRGWGQGTQATLDFLPEYTTDFAFSVLAEEFGWIGVATCSRCTCSWSGAACGSRCTRATRTHGCWPAAWGWRSSSTCW
jgi:cell division protein FtsW (lipid II flippase)